MRTDQQTGNTGSGFNDPLLGGPDFNGRRPWFGRNRIGYSYRPQTWQGWLLLAALTALLITVGSIAPKSPLFFVALAAIIVVPFAVIAVQRRW
ncbi:MAG TPA: hypothetical protein VMA72_10535 [Streptosporangiaceae bacterium]|nr:hypothetical protein [Streptosporangiaceae bacterium]